MMPSQIIYFVALCALCQFATAGKSSESSTHYDAFRRLHRKDSDEDSVSYDERYALFRARAAEVAAHNAQKKGWTKTINHFSDYTQDELQATLGYKPAPVRHGSSSFLQTSTAEIEVENINVKSLAKTMDWSSKTNTSNYVHNQGKCGSCWAHAAVSALEAHLDIATGSSRRLATQEIVDCTENPHQCGGQGGCHGATSQLAFDQIQRYGIRFEDEYTGSTAKCPQKSPHSSASSIKLQGFKTLKPLSASHLLWALSEKGPVALSVDGSGLHSYNQGVFHDCERDSVINHAVVGMGYGNDPESGMAYWLVKNSWGDHWGERGFFRIQRHSEGDAYCGTDHEPAKGVVCLDKDNKYPDTVPVCGMCGITTDSAYPILSRSAALQGNQFMG
jgi:cathepsin L